MEFMQKSNIKGTLVRWKDDKGFGFIQAEPELDRDVFIHASTLSHMSRRPKEGDIIYFQLERKSDGKFNAVEAYIDGVECKSEEDTNSKAKKGLRSQQRDTINSEKRANQSQSQTRGILYRIGIMMLVLAGASFAYNRVVGSSGVANDSFELSQSSIIAADNTPSSISNTGVNAISKAYQNRLNGVQVSSSGTVVKLLDDDNEGSRHQRFILRLSNEQTLLVAHNIDLAPRIDTIALGDTVEFNGQYEFNSKGGVIHWTHDDPQGKHVSGWLKHNGQIYH